VSAGDKLFLAVWFPFALVVAWVVPTTPKWPMAVTWWLIGAVTWHFVMKVARR
jgi:hypothetical protein